MPTHHLITEPIFIKYRDSGDLDVTIKEEDGSELHFVQPYSAVPILQREGHLKDSIIAGDRHRCHNGCLYR
ncbi:fimbria/pilus outer membrane usher protein [Hafnia paralvei]|nr:fimbria/pilus outer membrane usher protein [Hafnia paralvei]NIH32315.1 fimbria/pilus outer membrane usher protein [Hafnia paralvei]NUN42424.1 fimbria/pilus outer membrane usher protein [Hafnia paralvei]HCU14203.1 hypothetical protein [Hafnia paralvei]